MGVNLSNADPEESVWNDPHARGGEPRSVKWGPTRYERPLREILGAERAAAYLDPVRRAAAEKAAQTRAEARLSQHPTDRLVRELIGSRRGATAEEIGRIVNRMAEADFPTAAAHAQKRIRDKQWASNTEESEYLAHLQSAIRDRDARLAIYNRRGGSIAAVVADTAAHVPAGKRGVKAKPLLFVTYSADRSIIITGYQVDSLDDLSIPEEIRWLR